MGAAGAVGRRAGRHREVAGARAPGGAPRRPAPARRPARGSPRGTPVTSRATAASAMSGSMPDASGKPARAARERLAPDGLAAALEGPAHLVLDVAGPLLHHDHLVHQVGQPAHGRRVDRPGQPRAQHGYLAVQAELGEGVAQQRVGRAGGDEPEAARAAPARLEAVDARGGGRGPAGAAGAGRGGRPRGSWRTGAARRRDRRGSPPCRGRPGRAGRRRAGGWGRDPPRLRRRPARS